MWCNFAFADINFCQWCFGHNEQLLMLCLFWFAFSSSHCRVWVSFIDVNYSRNSNGSKDCLCIFVLAVGALAVEEWFLC